jgi:hypothetical protein
MSDQEKRVAQSYQEVTPVFHLRLPYSLLLYLMGWLAVPALKPAVQIFAADQYPDFFS